MMTGETNICHELHFYYSFLKKKLTDMLHNAISAVQQHWFQLHLLDYGKIPVHTGTVIECYLLGRFVPLDQTYTGREQNLNRKYGVQLKGNNTSSLIMLAFGNDKGWSHIQTLPCQII
jgi:hypothetical protein